MRWSYKTVHFGLKKDGLLGGAFVDDAEIEETLNEYGQGGWELVSMFETRDGVLAVFKQSLEYPSGRQRSPALYGDRAPTAASTVLAATRKSVPEPVREYTYEPEPEPDPDDIEEPEADDDAGFPIIDDEVEPEVFAEEDTDAEEDDSDSSIGSIRIE